MSKKSAKENGPKFWTLIPWAIWEGSKLIYLVKYSGLTQRQIKLVQSRENSPEGPCTTDVKQICNASSLVSTMTTNQKTQALVEFIYTIKFVKFVSNWAYKKVLNIPKKGDFARYRGTSSLQVLLKISVLKNF